MKKTFLFILSKLKLCMLTLLFCLIKKLLEGEGRRIITLHGIEKIIIYPLFVLHPPNPPTPIKARQGFGSPKVL